ncbi:Mut7-C RNAse domain-containing protein [Chitinispirillales bacterium ANBcel5]|uniref:Mut7-C RNAse domain-containing protein n=1 Tax=Cellulosispirillum alkaliphilum TaxID=3039283 RepID=UPI002A566102|nr:Mut7-C RNAse domain-containing protein [Chitinispirillales bacterium ANBcel5]
MEQNSAYVQLFGELNDFLPKTLKNKPIEVSFHGSPAVKDTIESLNVPHTEVYKIKVNKETVHFSYRLKDQEQVEVYPFTLNDQGNLFSQNCFILDVHLGKLARLLRLMGFDTLYNSSYCDQQIIHIALEHNRTILTRDIGILKNGKVKSGYWVRSTNPEMQIKEVQNRFSLCSKAKPFTLCLRCNGTLEKVSKQDIFSLLDEKTKQYYNEFTRCSVCRKIYWKGSHYTRLTDFLKKVCNQKIERVT